MEDDERLACRAGDAQPLPVQGEATDLGVVDVLGCAFARRDVVAGPDPAEAGAGEGEFTDELDDPGVVRVGADGLTEPGDHARGRALPVRVEVLLGGVEEHVPQAVGSRRETR